MDSIFAAVLDTNTLASGFVGFLIPNSTPGKLLHAWRAGTFRLVVSEHIIDELARTFQVRYFRSRLSEAEIASALALLRTDAHMVLLTAQVAGVATHPEDDLILATAVSARADYLVTGDKKLQQLGSYEGVAIVSPRRFLDLLEQAPPGE